MKSKKCLPVAIGVDWGTSSFRAFLFGKNGKILDQISSAEGIGQVNNGFQIVLMSYISVWLDIRPNVPIILSGMVGSKNGWHETPYLRCPLSLQTLGENLTSLVVEKKRLYFAPGLLADHSENGSDIMRGEETQVIGAGRLLNLNSGLFCLPGTHSKWVAVNKNIIENFHTFITGDVYASLSKHSLLAKSVDAKTTWDNTAFCQGVERSFEKESILSNLFEVRTADVISRRKSSWSTSFLSGLLIGEEIRAATKIYDIKQIILVGNSTLTEKYKSALNLFDVDVISVTGEDSSALGIWSYYQKIIKDSLLSHKD